MRDARSAETCEDSRQAVYRGIVALRAVVGSCDLDRLLTEKEAVAAELEKIILVSDLVWR
ncbi:MAG: hypothetical protein R2941_01970 [Desulfobacterales bacterium]